MVFQAAEVADSGRGTSAMASAVKAKSSSAALTVAKSAIQMHGGIGFTWESDVHIFFKRSMHNQALYGDGACQRSEIAEDLMGPA